MASLSAMFGQAIADLGNLASIWNPFAVIDARGLDGRPVFSPILPRIIAFGMGLLVLFLVLRILQALSQAIAGQAIPVLGLCAEAVLVAVLLVAYPEWVRLFPQVFTSLGHAIQSYGFQDLGGQVAGALAQMGDERASDFKLWSARAFELSIASLMAAQLSALALAMLWVIAKLQAYLFTFWYLLGPIALSTLIFPPLRHVGRIWFATLMGVSFMSVTGPLLFVILIRAQWIPHAFSAGGIMDAVTCLAFSILILITLLSIPVLSHSIWSGIESRIFSAVFVAAEGTSRTAAAAKMVGGRAKEAYDSFRAWRAASRTRKTLGNAAATEGSGGG